MKKSDFKELLSTKLGWDFWEPEDPAKQDHLIVFWWNGNTASDADPTTQTRVDDRAIEQRSWRQLSALCKQGRDVTGITRITGYFSKVPGWNAGKRQELKDRYRSGLNGLATVSAKSEGPVRGSAPAAGSHSDSGEPADSGPVHGKASAGKRVGPSRGAGGRFAKRSAGEGEAE